jgi:heme/copper-type cytochrome/quinol oxidase subunit 2
LFIIIIMSFILLYSIELYALAATKMEVIGSQWCWYYYYYSSSWCWYYELSSLFNCDIWSNRALGSVNSLNVDKLNTYTMNAVVINGINSDIININNIINGLKYSSLLISFYLYYYYIQLTQSLISTNSFSNYWSHLSYIDSIIYLNLCQSLLFLLSSFDIIHSYGINSLFIRLDAVPGRLNSLFFYFFNIIGFNKGYCYELCGIGHFSMQIIAVIIQLTDLEVLKYNNRNYSIKHLVKS